MVAFEKETRGGGCVETRLGVVAASRDGRLEA